MSHNPSSDQVDVSTNDSNAPNTKLRDMLSSGISSGAMQINDFKPINDTSLLIQYNIIDT